MKNIKIEALAERVRKRRSGKGLRETSNEIGISPSTLSRVENGKIPDLETFGKICAWLDDDPALYLGLRPSTAVQLRAQVHFKKEVAIKPETAKALSEMIMFAQQALQNEEELQG